MLEAVIKKTELLYHDIHMVFHFVTSFAFLEIIS